MIALEQDQSPLFTRIYTNRPSKDEKAEFQLHPLELQIRRAGPIPAGSHVVADVLKYLKDRLTSSRAATVTGAILWKAASELPRTQSAAAKLLSRAYVAGVKDAGNAGVPVLQRTRISDYLNKLGPDEWLIYLDCGPDSNGVHVWRPVRLKYRSEQSEQEIVKMLIMKDDGTVVSFE